MTQETEANPAEDSELLSDAGADETTDAPETELDDDGNPVEPEPEDDSEEVEHDGQKYKVPKALKPALMMQADYTRKTMDLAEQRKALDAERSQVSQANEEVLNARADLIATDRQLAQYENIDWRTWSMSDPASSQAAFIEYQQLRDGRAKLAETVTTKTKALADEAQHTRAKQFQDGLAVLQKDIPGWGPEIAAKLMDFGERDLGYSRAELDGITDPRAIKAIHAAYTLKQAQAKQTTVKKIAQAQATKPAATVSGKGSVAPTGLDDRLSTDEWIRRRNAQLAKKRA